MTKKAIKYLIILLVIPLIISIIIGLYQSTNSNGSNIDSNYNSLDPTENINQTTIDNQLNNENNPFLYLSIFTFLIITFAVWMYVRKKGDL